MYTVFSYTKATDAVLFFNVTSVLSILVNAIPRLSVKYSYFKYVKINNNYKTVILNLFLVLLILVMGIIFFLNKNRNIANLVCNTITDYYN